MMIPSRPPAVAADRVGLDGGVAIGVLGYRLGGPAGDLRLQPRAAIRLPFRRRGGVDADRVLAQDAAVGADEAELPW